MLIRLSSTSPVASGRLRDCYLHPEDPNKCIKIAKQKQPPRGWKRVRSLVRKKRNPNGREFEEYERCRKAGVPLERYFPKLYGYVETDLGPGLCLEFLRGTDSLPPVALRDYYLGKAAALRAHHEFIMRELAAFANFCVEHAIFALCANPANIGLLRDGGGYRLVAYDLKARKRFPSKSFLPYFRRHKIARVFRRTIERIRGSAFNPA